MIGNAHKKIREKFKFDIIPRIVLNEIESFLATWFKTFQTLKIQCIIVAASSFNMIDRRSFLRLMVVFARQSNAPSSNTARLYQDPERCTLYLSSIIII